MIWRVEHPRGGETGDVSHWPDHFGPMTWHRCIEDGCQERVDPWEHSTRCPKHRRHHAEELARVRQIVAANRRRQIDLDRADA